MKDVSITSQVMRFQAGLQVTHHDSLLPSRWAQGLLGAFSSQDLIK